MRKKKNIAIALVSIFFACMLVTLVGRELSHKKKTASAFEDYKAEASLIFEKWNLISPDFEIVQGISKNIYRVEITGFMGGATQYERLYHLINELDEITSTYPKILFIPFVIVNGIEYEVSGRELRNDEYDTVYTYVSNEEKEREQQFLSALKEKLPYEGLEEKYISNTALGTPSKKELSHDYYAMKASHRSKKYKWYNSSGDLICSATVRGWDFKEDKIVDDYISSVSFFGEYSHYKN